MNRPSADCMKFGRLLGPYMDGQLEASILLEIEEHVGSCESCREHVALNWAIRGSLRREVHGQAAPSGLQSRIANAMKAEQMRGESLASIAASGASAPVPSSAPELTRPELTRPVLTRQPQEQATRSSRSFRWQAFAPLASAAALTLLWNAYTHRSGAIFSGSSVPATQAGIVSADDSLAEFVSEHSSPLPPERTDPKEVRALEQYVGVPVHPARFEKGGARLVGGRVLPVHHQRAAMLQYVIGSGKDAQRVSVFIYDPRKIQISASDFAARAVGDTEVRVGRSNGYSVAVTQRNGVGYALASDLDADRSVQLAAFADGE